MWRILFKSHPVLLRALGARDAWLSSSCPDSRPVAEGQLEGRRDRPGCPRRNPVDPADQPEQPGQGCQTDLSLHPMHRVRFLVSIPEPPPAGTVSCWTSPRTTSKPNTPARLGKPAPSKPHRLMGAIKPP